MDFSIISHYFAEFNTVLVVLALCSLVSMAIFFERLLFLRKAETDSNSLIIHLRKALCEQNIMEAIRVCEVRGGAVSNILRTGLLKHERSKLEIEQAMEVAGLAEIARLEKNARILSVIAHIAPLIGLLGTVIGFIQAFSEMRVSGLMDISTTRVGEAMEYALVTTAAGLVVAIPTVVAYNYLISRIQAITLEMQVTSSEVVDLLTHREEYAL